MRTLFKARRRRIWKAEREDLLLSHRTGNSTYSQWPDWKVSQFTEWWVECSRRPCLSIEEQSLLNWALLLTHLPDHNSQIWKNQIVSKWLDYVSKEVGQKYPAPNQIKNHNVWHPIEDHQACKEAGKHIYGEEKNQPIKTNLEWTQALELVEKNIKIVTETGCQFQKVKLRCGRYI